MTTSARPLRQERSAPAEAATGSAPRGDHRSPDRIEGLDGLRALAIVGVLVYHLDAAWLPGGFLGCRRLLRRVGLPHHDAARARAPAHRQGRPLAVLGAPGATPAAGARAVRRHERAHRAGRQRRPARRRRAADGRRPDLLDQLARDHRGVELLRPDRTAAVHELLVAGGRGAVLPPLAPHHPRAARPVEPGPRRRGRGHRRRVGPAHGAALRARGRRHPRLLRHRHPRRRPHGRRRARLRVGQPSPGPLRHALAVGAVRRARRTGRPPRARRRDGAARRAAPAHLPRGHRAGLDRHRGARHGRHRPCAGSPPAGPRRSSGITPTPRRDVGGCALLLDLPLALARHPARRPRQPVGARHALARA